MAAMFVLLPAIGIATCQVQDRHPSDEQLIEELDAKLDQYVDLRDLAASETRVTRVSYDFGRIDGFRNFYPSETSEFLTASRWQVYRIAMKALDLESGVEKNRDGSISFYRSSSGLVTGGSSKGLLWSSRPQPEALAPTDDRSAEEACGQGNCFILKAIRPGWYIEYERH